MARQFKDRLRNITQVSDVVTHPVQKSAMTGTGAGSKHLEVYGPDKSRGASLGAHWAYAPQIKSQGSFNHTNGLYPDVHSHVGCFERSVNYSGGVTQTPAFGSSDADVGRAIIKDSKPDLTVTGQRSGRTFEQQRHQIRSKVVNKVGK